VRTGAPCWENHPLTSTATLTEPTAFHSDTVPLAETGTITRFGTTCPGPRLTLETFGRVVAPAYAVSTVPAVGSMAVRLRRSRVTPVAGMPSVPVRTLKVSTGRPAMMGLAPDRLH